MMESQASSSDGWGDNNDFQESILLDQFPNNIDGWISNDDYAESLSSSGASTNSGVVKTHNRRTPPPIIDFQNSENIFAGAGPQGHRRGQQAVDGGKHVVKTGRRDRGGTESGVGSTDSAPRTNSDQRNKIPATPHETTSAINSNSAVTSNIQQSEYDQLLNEMHLQHMQQVSRSAAAADFYNRPLEKTEILLPIDKIRQAQAMHGQSDEYGNDIDDESSDENDSDDDDGEKGKKRKSNGGHKREKGEKGEEPDIMAKAKNREHAKNTRLRKKKYIEALKESIKLLAEERERVDIERRVALSRLAEQVGS
jgi:hypothetical protein